MRPRLRLPLHVRIVAFLKGVDLATNAPVNGKGGPLRAMVRRLAHSPVYGMEIIEGHWWAHTERGWHPVSWYIEQARQEAIRLSTEDLQFCEGNRA